MTYTVYYKKRFIWRKIKNVKGDGIIEHGRGRFFILEDETRLEIPIIYHFKFSKERHFSIKDNMEKESRKSL